LTTKNNVKNDQRRGAKELVPLYEGQNVRMSTNSQQNPEWKPGVVVKKHDKPRSYVVQSENRLYRRNHKHLRMATEGSNDVAQSTGPDDIPTQTTVETPSPVLESPAPKPKVPDKQTCTRDYQTRSGRSVNKPQKLDL
jgi:hypothetical protein